MIVGYAVRDSLDAWACDPDPNAKPCYTSKSEERYVWQGDDAKERARAWIKAVRSVKATSAKRYFIVTITANDDTIELQERLRGLQDVLLSAMGESDEVKALITSLRLNAVTKSAAAARVNAWTGLQRAWMSAGLAPDDFKAIMEEVCQSPAWRFKSKPFDDAKEPG